MGLKENFSQAVKELTGNTKEDDKKRNVQVEGLKKALDDDQPYPEDYYPEDQNRSYYREDGQNYDNRDRDNGYRQGNAPDDRTNGDRRQQSAYSRPQQNANYQQQGRYDDYDRRPDDYDDRGYNSGQQQYDNRQQQYDSRQQQYDSRQDNRGDYRGQPAYSDRQYDNSRDGDYRYQDVNDRNADYRRQQEPVNDRNADFRQNDNDRYAAPQYDNYDDIDNRNYNNGYDNRQDRSYNSGNSRNADKRNYNDRRTSRREPERQQRPAYDNSRQQGSDSYSQASYNRNTNANYDRGRNTYSGAAPAREYREAPDNELTVISRNTIIDGNVRSFANMSIEGDIRGDVETTKDIELNGRIVGDIICSNANMVVSQVQGNIQLKGDVEIGRDTLLIGDLNSGFAKINGKIKGNVEITGKAEFKADAVVFGDISASTITVDDGAIIQGYVSTTFLNKEESERIFPEAIELGD